MDNMPALSLKTVLLVDDANDSRIMMKWFLSNLGYVVDAARSAEEALAVFNSSTHDIILTDNSMPGMTGAEMAHIIKMRSPSTPVLMYTRKAPQDRSCIDILLEKTAHVLDVKDAMDRLLARRETTSLVVGPDDRCDTSSPASSTGPARPLPPIST